MEQNRLKDLVDSALNGQVVFHLSLMIGTGFAANAAILPKIISFGITAKMASILAALVGMAAAIAIDGGFKKQLPYAVSVLSGGPDRSTGVERKRGFNVVVVILVLLTGGTSLFFNWKVTPEITSTIIEAPDGTKQTAMSATISSKYDRDVVRLEEAVDRAEQALVKAQNDSQNAQKEAERALGSKMASLVRQGNGWAINQVNAAKRKAERRHRRIISKAEEALSVAQGDLSEYINVNGATVTSAQAALVDEYKKESYEATQARGRWGSAFIVFWIVSFVGFIGCTVIVVVYEDETGEDVTHNPTIFSVVWNLIIRAKNLALAKVIHVAGLQYAFVMPQVATGTVLNSPPTPRSKKPEKPRTEQHRSAQNRKDCTSGKCSTESQEVRTERTEAQKIQHRTTQNDTELQTSLSAQGRVEGWPLPSDGAEWGKFTRKAREWWRYAHATDSEQTRDKNLERWAKAVGHCASVGYEATTEMDADGNTKPVIRKAEYGAANEVAENTFEWTGASTPSVQNA